MPNFQKYTSVAFNNPQDTNKFAKPLVVNGDNRRAAEERICVSCGDSFISMSEAEAYRLCENLINTLNYIADEDDPDTLLS